jgi:hypothetical protein
MTSGEHPMLKSAKSRAVAASTGLLVLTAPALAGTPPTMPAIELPIDLASVASAVAVVGGTMLLAWAGIFIGFKLARKFIGRAGKTV